MVVSIGNGTPDPKSREAPSDISRSGRHHASSLGGKSVVVFEKLYTAEGKEIANHEDINDEGQTVKLVAPTKEAVKKTENKTTIPKNTGIVQTGDSYRMYVLAAGAVVLVVVGGFMSFKKNKKKGNKK